MLRSRVMASLLTLKAFSEQCEEKLVHVVLLLYLVVSSALRTYVRTFSSHYRRARPFELF